MAMKRTSSIAWTNGTVLEMILCVYVARYLQSMSLLRMLMLEIQVVRRPQEHAESISKEQLRNSSQDEWSITEQLGSSLLRELSDPLHRVGRSNHITSLAQKLHATSSEQPNISQLTSTQTLYNYSFR